MKGPGSGREGLWQRLQLIKYWEGGLRSPGEGSPARGPSEQEAVGFAASGADLAHPRSWRAESPQHRFLVPSCRFLSNLYPTPILLHRAPLPNWKSRKDTVEDPGLMGLGKPALVSPPEPGTGP